MTGAWLGQREVLAAVAAQNQQIKEQKGRLQAFQDWHREQRKKLEREIAESNAELGRFLLPTLDEASIARAATMSGLVTLPTYRLPEALAAERARLEHRLREILADTRYRDRELLRHPRTGSLPRSYAEMQEHRKPWALVMSTCEAHPRFQRLWDTGFGTSSYTGAWWRLSTFSDKSAGREIAALFPERASFVEVRDEYEKARDTVQKLDAEITRIAAELHASEALDREYAELYEQHRTLDTRWADDTRGRLIRHMVSLDPSLLAARLEGAKDLKLLYLRSSGLTSKLTYLDQMSGERVRAELSELAPVEQKMARIARSAHKGMPREKFAAAFKDRRPKYDKQWERFGRQYNRVYLFQRYDRARIAEDFLWWDLMTDGRVDGRYLPEVDLFYRSHPGYVYEPPPRHVRDDDGDLADRGPLSAAERDLGDDAAAAEAAADRSSPAAHEARDPS